MHKKNLKWSMGLIVRPNTIKFLSKNPGENLCGFEVVRMFFNMKPETETVKKKGGKGSSTGPSWNYVIRAFVFVAIYSR